MKVAYVFIIAAALIAIAVFTPTTAYALDVLVNVSSDYQMSFTPEFVVKQVPSWQVAGNGFQLKPMALDLGVDRIAFFVNVSAANTNGTAFFEAKFALDTIAVNKVTLWKAYDPALRTSNMSITVDASLLVDFTNRTDIYREFHRSWVLSLP